MEKKENTTASPVNARVLPQSQGILVLGIFSLVTTFCCGGIGFVGLILGIIAVVMATKATRTYEEDPEAYTEISYKNVNAGKICGIIGICVNGLLILAGILYLMILGAGLATFFSTFPWEKYIR